MAALLWLMDNHISTKQTLTDLCLTLARFVLKSNFLVCMDLGCRIYSQMVWTAMGTSYSVVYAEILILETPKVNDVKFLSLNRQYILQCHYTSNLLMTSS